MCLAVKRFLDTNCRWARVVTTRGYPSHGASAEHPPSKPDEVSLKMPSKMDVAPWDIL